MAFETLKENRPFYSERKCLLWRYMHQTIVIDIKILRDVISVH